MTCEGASHLASVNDVLTGSFRYLVNDTESRETRSEILRLLIELMWKDKKGQFSEYGFTLRPYNRSNLAKEIGVEYDRLRSELNLIATQLKQ
jgi:hypothetical protein